MKNRKKSVVEIKARKIEGRKKAMRRIAKIFEISMGGYFALPI